MNEARIILPARDNDGFDLKHIHRALKIDLVETFGGFTAAKAEGGWYCQEQGKLYLEDVVTYDIAIKDEDLHKLFALADAYCGLARQECVYVRTNGVVQFVEHTREAAVQVAA